ncbi:ketoacyl-ACP synthase III [Ectothiorhodospiraceae bacterium BW-2]|nr:ketoacyl-ACP synthase III [Ectothiorhodospiraceae bacterium BW-2]
MRYTKITATGSYLPERILTNADLEQMVDTTDEWITTRTGIKQRHLVSSGQSTVDLAEQAAQQALQAADMSAAELDLIIVATTTPDQIFPSTACLLQQRLDNHGAAAFDVQAVCTGFIYALTVADKFIQSGSHKKVLVVGAETMSAITDWSDRGTSILFGDGAGAVVLEPSDEAGILSTHLHADGQYKDLLQIQAGVSTDYSAILAGSAYVEMRGNEVFKVAVNTLGQIVDETLAANCMDRGDIDWLVPHQANIRIIQATAKKLKMGMERVVVTVDRHGNTSGASVPLALDTAVRDGRIQRGEVLLLEAFGGGFTWGSVLVRY